MTCMGCAGSLVVHLSTQPVRNMIVKASVRNHSLHKEMVGGLTANAQPCLASWRRLAPPFVLQ